MAEEGRPLTHVEYEEMQVRIHARQMAQWRQEVEGVITPLMTNLEQQTAQGNLWARVGLCVVEGVIVSAIILIAHWLW